MATEAHTVEIDGLPIRYLSAGEGPPLVLVHGAGNNSLDWRWVMPTLAATHRVYALDLLGSPDSARPAADYSPAFFERFMAGFLDALGIERATMVGNSLGGLITLRLALSEPARVTSLVLVDSAGLGSEINPAFTSVNVPGLAEAAFPIWRTPIGAYERAWGRTALLFAHPPRKRSARVVSGTVQAGPIAGLPGSPPERALPPGEPPGSTRGAGGPFAVLEDPDPRRVGDARPGVPRAHAKEAVVRLRRGSLALIPDCGHMPHVECPDRFLAALDGFPLGADTVDR